MKFIKVDGK